MGIVANQIFAEIVAKLIEKAKKDRKKKVENEHTVIRKQKNGGRQQ